MKKQNSVEEEKRDQKNRYSVGGRYSKLPQPQTTRARFSVRPKETPKGALGLPPGTTSKRSDQLQKLSEGMRKKISDIEERKTAFNKAVITKRTAETPVPRSTTMKTGESSISKGANSSGIPKLKAPKGEPSGRASVAPEPASA